MAQDFNVYPYYDDFDENKNFHKILFKPGTAVQARELTQIQTLIQDQIKKFGNHVFKHGSVVIPGNSGSDLEAPYVTLGDLSANQLALLPSFENKIVTGSTTGITALIRKAVAADGADPTTLYLAYQGGGANGESVFADGESLVVSGTTTVTASAANATGLGSLAFINKGVYYVYGNFVTVSKQLITISKYTQNPSCHVLLRITDEIIDADADETLLDPAQGSYNFSAPGADRQKISLTLTSLPLNSNIDDNYFEIMRYNNGVLEEHSRYPKYNELEKSLARRTYDESGDYVVNGLDLSVREHLNSTINGGVYAASEGGDSSKFVAEVTPGKAYIGGYENEKLAKVLIAVDKGRTAEHIKAKTNIGLLPQFGQYVYISDVKNLPSFASRETVSFYDALGILMGTAKILTVDSHVPSSTNALNILKLFIYDLKINGNELSYLSTIRNSLGTQIANVTHKLGVSVTGTDFMSGDVISLRGTAVGTTTQYIRSSGVLYYTKTVAAFPIVGDKITSGSKEGNVNSTESGGNLRGNSPIVELPFDSVYKVRKADDSVDVTYRVYKQVDITLNNGVGSGSIVGATMESFDQADPLVVHTTLGVLPVTSDNVVINSNTIDITGLVGINGLVSVIVTATKTNQTNRAKTLSVTSETRAATSNIKLAKCDVYKINSVIQVSTNADVTSAYVLDNGQRDYAYQNGELNLVGSLPAGNVVISYQYFQHSGSGDYFAVDSYELSGLGSGYYDVIPQYRSTTDGKIYDLKNCLDFRTRVNSTDPTDSALSDLVQIDARITTSMQHYVPRSDIVVMNKSGAITNIEGIPSDNPVVPAQPAETLLIGTLNIPAYTPKIKDIKVVRAKNQGYTMSEISKIEDRVFRLEQYSLLNQSEQSLINTEIIDASTGLTKFKSGYLVDAFDNADAISDVFNPEFSATYFDGMLIPMLERNEADLEIATSSNVRLTNDFLTLPYTEVVFAQQNLSSRVTNVNPFAVFSWNGVMTLTPTADSWVETEFLPKIFNETVTNITEDVIVNRPWNWQPTPGAEVRFAPRPAPIATGGGGCFIASAVVEMADGTTRRIIEVRPGDLVWNWDRTKTNVVTFIEKVKNKGKLFSPHSDVKPFATMNHPLYIDGVLSTVDSNCNYSKWLGPIKLIEPTETAEYTGDVYNLWVTGDHTFVVNGYGTTSIVGDGGWMTQMFQEGKMDAEEIVELVEAISVNNSTQYGAFLVNTAISGNKIRIFNSLMVKILRKDSILRKIAIGMFAAIGKINQGSN